MASLKLWEILKDLQKNYRWVDLTHELSPELHTGMDSSLLSRRFYSTIPMIQMKTKRLR